MRESIPLLYSLRRLPGGVEQLLMAYNKLPDVGQVVHTVTLLHQNLLCVSANTGMSTKQHNANETNFAPLHGMDTEAHAASVTGRQVAKRSNKSQAQSAALYNDLWQKRVRCHDIKHVVNFDVCYLPMMS